MSTFPEFDYTIAFYPELMNWIAHYPSRLTNVVDIVLHISVESSTMQSKSIS